MNQDYKKYFMQTTRVSGAPITIVKPDLFHEFMEAVAADTEMENELKLFLLVSLSGGLRISECTKLQKNSFVKQPEGDYFIKVTVLKKKVRTTREIACPEFCTPFIDAILMSKRTFEYIFIERQPGRAARAFTRHDISYRLHKYFGIDSLSPHSMRHATISKLIDSGETHISISSLLKVSLRIVTTYAHTQGGSKFRGMHKKKVS